MIAEPRGIHHERLVRLAAVVTVAGQAPGAGLLIVGGGPGAREMDDGAVGRAPFTLAHQVPVVRCVLLAVAVGMAATGRERAAERGRAV